jgi:hypothetical protein
MSKSEQIIDQILSESMDTTSGKLSAEQQRQLLFMMLIQQHEQIGLMGLGRLADSNGDSSTKDLNATRYSIDTLKMLEHFTQGNLGQEMKSYLQHKLQLLEQGYEEELKNEEGS